MTPDPGALLDAYRAAVRANPGQVVIFKDISGDLYAVGDVAEFVGHLLGHAPKMEDQVPFLLVPKGAADALMRRLLSETGRFVIRPFPGPQDAGSPRPRGAPPSGVGRPS